MSHTSHPYSMRLVILRPWKSRWFVRRDFKRPLKEDVLLREFLEKKLKVKLNSISNFSFTEEQVSGRNIENLIGATQIPLGVAGPLTIDNGQSAKHF